MVNLFFRFQLTRSRGAWLSITIWGGVTWLFQLTRSRGAWHAIDNIRTRSAWFQLTRSRGAWLNPSINDIRNYQISTHTLTWSVTPALMILWIKSKNFNSHAHVERDIKLYSATHWLRYFNSHAHVERDLHEATYQQKYYNISTHTLTWSVTNEYYSLW